MVDKGWFWQMSGKVYLWCRCWLGCTVRTQFPKKAGNVQLDGNAYNGGGIGIDDGFALLHVVLRCSGKFAFFI